VDYRDMHIWYGAVPAAATVPRLRGHAAQDLISHPGGTLAVAQGFSPRPAPCYTVSRL